MQSYCTDAMDAKLQTVDPILFVYFLGSTGVSLAKQCLLVLQELNIRPGSIEEIVSIPLCP